MENLENSVAIPSRKDKPNNGNKNNSFNTVLNENFAAFFCGVRYLSTKSKVEYFTQMPLNEFHANRNFELLYRLNACQMLSTHHGDMIKESLKL